MVMDRPTGDEIDKLYEALLAHYKNFHGQCETEDTYYRREFPVECDESATPIKLPIAKTAIDDATAQVDTTSLNIYVPAATSTYGGDVGANKRRRYLIGSWHMCRTYNGLVLHHAVKHGFLYGMSILKLMADPEAPFQMPVEAINPQCFFPDPARRFVIEAYQRKGLEVKAEFSSYYTDENDDEAVDDLVVDDTAEALWIEYWDDTYCTYRYGGKTVLRMQHNYGFLPYFWGDAGLGTKDRDNKPECLYVGLLNPVHSLLEAQSRLMTQGESISKQYAWPELDFVSETVERAKKIIAEWELGPGRHHALDRSTEVKRVTPTSVPPEIMSLMQIVGDFVENATVPGIVRGERPQGASSGYMTAVLAGLARVKFGGVVALIESLIQQVNMGYLKLVENVFEEITVWGRTRAGEEICDTITKADVGGSYVNFVDVSAIPPEEQERTLMVGSRLRQAKQISRRYWVTNFLKPTDPEAELEQQYLDIFMESETGQQLVSQLAFKNYEAAQMLTNVGADQAANIIRGTAGAAVPPMGGEYTEQDRAYGRPQQAGSVGELSAIGKTIGAQGVLPHVTNARREVIDQLKRRGQG
jgi:hypothetical protein